MSRREMHILKHTYNMCQQISRETAGSKGFCNRFVLPPRNPPKQRIRAQRTWLCSSPLGASRTRLRPFSQGRISKKIPPGPAVTLYFEVPARHRPALGRGSDEAGGCAPVPLGVSHCFVKLQNMGSPPTHAIDMALPTARLPARRAYSSERGRNGAWPRN